MFLNILQQRSDSVNYVVLKFCSNSADQNRRVAELLQVDYKYVVVYYYTFQNKMQIKARIMESCVVLSKVLNLKVP